jgi:hypothetical protein
MSVAVVWVMAAIRRSELIWDLQLTKKMDATNYRAEIAYVIVVELNVQIRPRNRLRLNARHAMVPDFQRSRSQSSRIEKSILSRARNAVVRGAEAADWGGLERPKSAVLIALAFVVLDLIERFEPAAAVAGVQTSERQGRSWFEGSSQGDDRANSFLKLTHTQKHGNNPN